MNEHDHADDAALTLQHPGGLRITLSDWGASWLSCQVPMAEGDRREALVPPRRARIGGDQPRTFMGATLGRYANRIAHGQIERDGQAWPLALGSGERHQLHGGPDGWDARRWTREAVTPDSACFTLTSPAGDQGYPGTAHASVTYALVDAQTLEITYAATVDAPCPVALSNHAYFNLDARLEGACTDVRHHPLQIHAARYLPVDAELIPRGELAPVAGTSFDFTTPHTVAARWQADAQQQLGGGYDHAFLLDAPGLDAPQVELTSADGRLRLQLSTTLPAVQLYTGQGLAGLPAPGGRCHTACAGLALEPQWLPDSPHHPAWPQPDVWLMPGDVRSQRIRYRFVAA
jgi:aldose 1-epimerase